MAEIHVPIAGRSYRMACDDGQEEHLRALAARLDLKIAEMRVRFGEIGDQRITVMAALTLADEADAAEKQAGSQAAEIKALRESGRPPEADNDAYTEAVGAALTDLARRIERIRRSVQSKPERSEP